MTSELEETVARLCAVWRRQPDPFAAEVAAALAEAGRVLHDAAAGGARAPPAAEATTG